MTALLLLTLVLAAGLPGQHVEHCGEVAVYDPCELLTELGPGDLEKFPDAFRSVALKVEFRSPKGGRTKVMPAFWDGGGRFAVRFSPDFEGRWDFRLISNVEGLDRQTGSFLAMPAATPGFIEVFNSRHFKYPLTNSGHYWLGASMPPLASQPREAFEAMAQERSEQGFTHMRASVLPQPGRGAQPFGPEGEPEVGYFQELDRRVELLHRLGIVTDLVLAESGDHLEELFPRRRSQEWYVRYACARYSAYSVTWQILREWESHESGARLTERIAGMLNEHDPYRHPKSTGATVTSAVLSQDGWQDYYIQNRVDPALASIEYETTRGPFVNTGVGLGAIAANARKQAWTATTRGHYVTLSGSDGATDPAAAAEMAPLRKFFDQTRYFDLEPHYRVAGGSALALHRVPRWSERAIGIEHIVYAGEPGLIELLMPKQEYKVSWFDPATGAWFDQKKKFKGDRYRSRTPDDAHDWVLYVRREGKKQDYNRSFFLESKPPRFREVEVNPSAVPFEIQLPAESKLHVGREHQFNATLLKDTIAARRMVWIWLASVAGSDRGARLLGTGQGGSFAVPTVMVAGYPATLLVRAIGLDGAGRLFEAIRTYDLQPPE